MHKFSMHSCEFNNTLRRSCNMTKQASSQGYKTDSTHKSIKSKNTLRQRSHDPENTFSQNQHLFMIKDPKTAIIE